MSPRRAPGESRAAILEAARTQFAEVGYQHATIRRIARVAGVDPALVIQYFGSKDDLLAASLQMPVDIAALTAGIEDHPDLGTELVRRALAIWESPPVRAALLGMLRTGMSHQRAGDVLSALLQRSVLGVVQRYATGEDATFRAALVGAQMAGLAMGRLALHVPELAEASIEQLANAVGPTVTRYLTGDLAGALPPRPRS
ncbi:TetR family transcriptional regulator [Isoptericola sp. b490]|uniref:TetR/AcrR family transcriptional regulator n=1 Tax=Actinotalea lenta TaxID=3064654 RepID=UPI002712D07E|nr:TetR family transcriptional regulator [Isoptericola sp. b490]MDO8121300.1 TetR family transcriptional regulator [Isoptericola sp. b490]